MGKYIHIKEIKGHKYAYISESTRNGKTIINKHIKYLGRYDKLSKLDIDKALGSV